jgi:hypothetical protein
MVGGIAGGYGLSGFLNAFDRASSQMVAATTDTSASAPDLVDGMVGSMLAAEAVKASISVLKSADEMVGTLLDALA